MQIPKLEILNINKYSYKNSSKPCVQNVNLKTCNDNMPFLGYSYFVSFSGNKKFKSDNKKINIYDEIVKRNEYSKYEQSIEELDNLLRFNKCITPSERRKLLSCLNSNTVDAAKLIANSEIADDLVYPVISNLSQDNLRFVKHILIKYPHSYMLQTELFPDLLRCVKPSNEDFYINLDDSDYKWLAEHSKSELFQTLNRSKLNLLKEYYNADNADICFYPYTDFINNVDFDKYKAVANLYKDVLNNRIPQDFADRLIAEYGNFNDNHSIQNIISFYNDKNLTEDDKLMCLKMINWETIKIFDRLIESSNYNSVPKFFELACFRDIFPLMYTILNNSDLYEDEQYNILLKCYYVPNKIYPVIRLLGNADFPIILEGENFVDSLNNSALSYSALHYNPKSYEIFENQEKLCINHPELYTNNDENADIEIQKNTVKSFFDKRRAILMLFAGIFDKETMDLFMRERFDDVEDYYIHTVNFWGYDDWVNFDKLVKSKDIDGKPFSPAQKLGFIELAEISRLGFISDSSKFQDMLKNGRVDVSLLKKDIWKNIMTSIFTEDEYNEIPIEKLFNWNLEYAQLLGLEISENADDTNMDNLKNIIKQATIGKFDNFIANEFTNYATKFIFNSRKLDYDKWLHPDPKFETKYITKDLNLDYLKQVSHQVEEDVNKLLKDDNVRKIIAKKSIVQYVEGDVLTIPANIYSNKTYLYNFVSELRKQFDGIFTYASISLKKNRTNGAAKEILTIKNHIEQRLKDIQSAKNANAEKPVNFTIKMWARDPKKDLFQGNFSTCCIGMGEINSSAISQYLLYTPFNMVEIIDNNTSRTVGNALCYFIESYDNNNQPEISIVIDNIEINNRYKLSEANGKILRTKIAEYVQNIANDVSGHPNTKVYLGTSYNDVPDEDLSEETLNASIVGQFDDETEYYIDALGGWTELSNEHSTKNKKGINICLEDSKEEIDLLRVL